MAKRRSGKKLEDIYVTKYNTFYTLFLSPGNTFYATWNNLQIAHADTADECKRRAENHIADGSAHDWLPAIRVSFPIPSHVDHTATFIIFKASRVYVAKRKTDGKWIEETWNTEPARRHGQEIRLFRRELTMPSSDRYKPTPPEPEALPLIRQEYNGEPDTVYSEYTEQKWSDLEALKGRVEFLRQYLYGILGEAELQSLRALASGTAGFMPALAGTKTPAEAREKAAKGILSIEAPQSLPAPPAPDTEGIPGAGKHGEGWCPGFYEAPTETNLADPERMEKHKAAAPCCDRAGEYNGGGESQPCKFVCPVGCPCHD